MKKQYLILLASAIMLFAINSESIAQNDIANSRQNAITRAIEKASPAIVGINVTEVRQVLYRNPYSGSLFERFFGKQRDRVREYEVKGLGSGFIISPDGYILTNNHVAGNAKKVVITTTDGKRYDAEIIGTDPATDIALLKIKADEKLPYIQFANSNDLIIGEWAIALGNPFGLFDLNAKPTVTVGVISNKGVNFLEEQDKRLTVYKDMIQTDAAISSGNSGGPLVNAEGKAIGMNTMIFSTAQSQSGSGSIGIGFSIPINRVSQIVDLIKSKKVINRNVFLGLEIQEIDDKVISYLNLPDIRGVVIYSTQNNGPANKAGLEPGDVILSINGRKVMREDDFYIEVYDSMVGETMEFQILRGDKEKTIKLQLEEPQQNKRYR